MVSKPSINEKSQQCFNCDHTNLPVQRFCGSCGAPLLLPAFIATRVEVEVGKAVRDRDIVETESAIKVFERAWGWVKIVGSVAAVLLAILGGGIIWQVSDWRNSLERAKQTVADSASAKSNEINKTSAKSIQEIEAKSRAATDASQNVAENAIRLTNDLKATAARTKSDLSEDAREVQKEVGHSREGLAAVNQLQPEFQDMRSQLSKATQAIAEQQKVISTSEEFAKKIFSSHAVELFTLDQFVKSRSIVDPAPDDKGVTVVYLLLPNTPIPGTLQVQYNIFVQLPNTYTNIHNLVIFYWGDPAKSLSDKPLSISYFPDTSDKELIQSISVHDGRVFADDQPMPKIGRPDLDFKGNKWMPIIKPKP